MSEKINENKEAIYEVRNLNLWYGKDNALKNINIDIYKNEVTAIIGPSGCGKSTFIKTLNRMIENIPSVKVEGEILYHGKNIFDRDLRVEELRTKVGMVFQKPNPFPKSIMENVVYGPRIHGITDKKLLMEITETSLRSAALWDEVKDRLNDNAYGLSGGQQQRLCIARALAMRPEVLLFDEPCSALDPISTSRIESLMESLRGKYTQIIVTHNMQQAARVSDYTAYFYMGEMIEFGETKQIFENPREKSTEDYITGRFG